MVEGDSGETYTQNVTVYAASAQEAKNLVNAEFARLRRFSTDKQRPYLRNAPSGRSTRSRSTKRS